MSGSVNKVILIGNLTVDPEIRRTQDGKAVANFSVATNESWRDKNTGERKDRAEFHRVVCFGHCKFIEQYVKKGSKVYIEGQLQTRKWQDQSGADRYSTEVVLQGFNSTLTLLDSKSQSDSQPNQSYGDVKDGDRSFSGGGEIDDEIPFFPEWRA